MVYIWRIRIEKGAVQKIPVAITNKNKKHHLSINKATETASGDVLFSGTTAKLVGKNLKKEKNLSSLATP